MSDKGELYTHTSMCVCVCIYSCTVAVVTHLGEERDRTKKIEEIKEYTHKVF